MRLTSGELGSAKHEQFNEYNAELLDHRDALLGRLRLAPILCKQLTGFDPDEALWAWLAARTSM